MSALLGGQSRRISAAPVKDSAVARTLRRSYRAWIACFVVASASGSQDLRIADRWSLRLLRLLRHGYG